MRILLCRTDNIGDVVLTLPMAGVLKKYFPQSEILFLGKTYTGSVIKLSQHVDGFLNWSEWENLQDAEIVQKLKDLDLQTIIFVFPHQRLAKLSFFAGIPQRVGTSRRWFHWLYLNRRISFSRNKSDLHEAQLNLQLLRHFNLPIDLDTKSLANFYGVKKATTINREIEAFIDPQKFNLILHPLSFGSALEWGQKQFSELIQKIDHSKFNVIITGTEKERGALLTNLITPNLSQIKDATGKFKLEEFIELIGKCDGLIAASTGPLHIASMLGLNTLGLYSCRRPIHPGRWSPIGLRANYLTTQHDQDPLDSISVEEVLQKISEWKK